MSLSLANTKHVMQLRHAGLHGVISNKLYSGSNAMVAEWEICETRTVVEKLELKRKCIPSATTAF